MSLLIKMSRLRGNLLVDAVTNFYADIFWKKGKLNFKLLCNLPDHVNYQQYKKHLIISMWETQNMN